MRSKEHTRGYENGVLFIRISGIAAAEETSERCGLDYGDYNQGFRQAILEHKMKHDKGDSDDELRN